ncbi:putative nuclease HARBI1 [Cucumis melo var. makuwa]|uniref:Nuclease HARBI1 n=1 Tax=Cucumis melo var. makuwa TaxID=1194695 RepID=A0A5A7V6L4_CUCMM|nr:putative nuclease HARBI1 [Cucumis melo var. makuwa]TYK05187.1 putative nuclease HARBI1 [Cucumis melo var. makuwa]
MYLKRLAIELGKEYFHHESDLNFLGALDNTYIKANVPAHEQLQYRTQKGNVATNVRVYDTKGDFFFILTCWEGSITNSQILRDAISRTNDLKVPKEFYYICDVDYPKAKGFLAPYRGMTTLVECLMQLFSGSGWQSNNRTFRLGTFLHYDDLSYIFGRDHATVKRAKTFVDVGSNVPRGYERFAAEDGNDMGIPTMVTQGLKNVAL